MKLGVLSAALVLATVAPGFAAEIGGSYNVNGKNFDGSAYKGTAQIKVTSDTTCTIKWSIGSGSSQGICMRMGNSFAAGYTLGKDVGLVIYELKSDGTLNGVWTIVGQNGAGSEVLTPR